MTVQVRAQGAQRQNAMLMQQMVDKQVWTFKLAIKQHTN